MGADVGFIAEGEAIDGAVGGKALGTTVGLKEMIGCEDWTIVGLAVTDAVVVVGNELMVGDDGVAVTVVMTGVAAWLGFEVVTLVGVAGRNGVDKGVPAGVDGILVTDDGAEGDVVEVIVAV